MIYQIRKATQGFTLVDTRTDTVLPVHLRNRKAAERECLYLNQEHDRLADRPPFNPYVEADQPGGFDSVRGDERYS